MRRDKALQVELETLRLENARLKAAQGAQHQAAHYLHAQDSGYRLLFERNPQVMWVYDAQTLAFLAVNDAAVQHFGYSRAEFLMMTLRDLYPPEDIPTLMSVIQEPASPLTGIWRQLKKDRSLTYVEITSHSLCFAGHTTCMSLVVDLTARRQAQWELREKEARLLYAMSGARCLFWTADVHSMPDGDMDMYWDLQIPDEEAAQRFFSLDVPPGEPYHWAWAKSRLPEDMDRTKHFGTQEIHAGRSYSQEFRCRRRDGEIRWLHEDVHVETVTSRKWRLIGVCTDITERKRAEERLRQTISGARCLVWHAQIQQVNGESAGDLKILEGCDGLPDRPIQPHFSWDLKIQNEELAPAFLPIAVLPGQSFSDAWYKSVLPEHWEQMHLTSIQSLRSGLPGYSNEFRCRMQDGTIRWLHEDVRLDLLAPGLWQAVGVCIDITERKQAEEALQQKAQELARSNAELERFAYVASHDLQEPLRMISSFTQLLQKRYQGQLDADADEFIGFAVDGTVRMQRLIRDLLAYARVARQGKELEPTDSAQVLQTTLTNLKAAIKESGAVLTYDPLPMVLADGSQLGQVFQNLIGNALKFRGKRQPEIHVGVKEQEGEWEFRVRDNGIGIEAQYAERIFVIFQRLHTRDQYPGTGIGLAICRKIIERHKGRIWLESKPGEGTTFFFTLPMC